MTDNGGAMGTGSVSTEIAKDTIKSLDADSPASSTDIRMEKGDTFTVRERRGSTISITNDEPFPEDPDGEIETQQFTVRAVLVGCILGGLIAASKYSTLLINREQY